jgi:hypothetical protein
MIGNKRVKPFGKEAQKVLEKLARLYCADEPDTSIFVKEAALLVWGAGAYKDIVPQEQISLIEIMAEYAAALEVEKFEILLNITVAELHRRKEVLAMKTLDCNYNVCGQCKRNLGDGYCRGPRNCSEYKSREDNSEEKEEENDAN